MSTKSKDLYYDVDALDTVKKKVSSLHGNYIVTGPASDADNVHASGTKIRNILNSLDNYDDSYDNCFSKYDLSSKANIIYNKSQLFLENWLDFDEAFVTSYKLLGDSTTTATTILNEFEGLTNASNKNSAPRINSPYDQAEWIKKTKGEDSKEYEDYMKLLHPDEKKDQKANAKKTKKGSKSKASNSSGDDTGGKTASDGVVAVPFIYYPTSPSNNNDNSSPKSEEPTGFGPAPDKDDNSKSEKPTGFGPASDDDKKKEPVVKNLFPNPDKTHPESDKDNPTNKIEPALNPNKKPDNNNNNNNGNNNSSDVEVPKEEASTPTTSPSDNTTPVENPGTDEPVQVVTPSDNQQYTAPVNNNQNNNYYQAPAEQVNNNSSSQEAVAAPIDNGGDTPNSGESTTSTQGPIVDNSDIGNTTDLFGDSSSADSGKGGVITDLPDSSSSSSSSSSAKDSKGFNPVPIAVGLGAAALGGVGVKAYKSHKENSDFDDVNEDSFTNGNRFWSDEEPNTIHTEQNELSGEDLLKEQTTAPSYEAMSNGNNDTWNIDDNSQDGGSDNQMLDLLS